MRPARSPRRWVTVSALASTGARAIFPIADRCCGKGVRSVGARPGADERPRTNGDN